MYFIAPLNHSGSKSQGTDWLWVYSGCRRFWASPSQGMPVVRWGRLLLCFIHTRGNKVLHKPILFHHKTHFGRDKPNTGMKSKTLVLIFKSNQAYFSPSWQQSDLWFCTVTYCCNMARQCNFNIKTWKNQKSPSGKQHRTAVQVLERNDM